MLQYPQAGSDSRLFVVYEILVKTVKILDREGVGRVYLDKLGGVYPLGGHNLERRRRLYEIVFGQLLLQPSI